VLVKKKGFYFSLEALFAIFLLLGVVITISNTYSYLPQRKQTELITKDVLNLLSEIKINQINHPFFIEQIKNQNIIDTDISVIELVGKEWIKGNFNLSRNIAQKFLMEYLSYDKNLEIVINDNNTYITIFNTTKPDNLSSITQSSKIISGIELRKPIEGFTTKSFLKNIQNKTESEFLYFGGFIGQGNISKNFFLNNFKNITNVYFEGDIKSSFQIYINENKCEDTFFPSLNNNISVFNLTQCKNLFFEGNNIFKLYFNESLNSSYIGGGFLQVDYISSNMFLEKKEEITYLPNISGIINVFDGINFKNNLEELEIYLKYKTNYSFYFNLGNITIYENNNTNNTISSINLNNSYLSQVLDYKSLENKTIPFRIGTKNFSSVSGTEKIGMGDIVLVTDVSGSMNWNFNWNYWNGVTRNCDDPQLYDWTTKRISVAKCISQDFINNVLFNITGNRVGLVSYESSTRDIFNLNSNITQLNSEINSYYANGGTCISCGIKDATDILIEDYPINRTRAIIVMSDGEANYCYSESGAQSCSTTQARQEAVDFACEAHNNYDIKIYSVAFGKTANKDTLIDIATCDNSSNFFESDEAEELMEIYEYISQDMMKEIVIEKTQDYGVIGEFENSILFSDSYINPKYNNSLTELEYGKIKLDFIQKINKTNPIIKIPEKLNIVDAKITSYSSNFWTHSVIFNSQTIYNLSNYNSNFSDLGDPFVIKIDPYLIEKENEVIIISKNSEGEEFISNNNSFIYTGFIVSNTIYSPVLEKNEGCYLTVETIFNNNLSFNVPQNYNGTNVCFYTKNNVLFNFNDSIQYTIYNLLKQLDLEDDGRIVVDFDDKDLEIIFMSVSKVPYMWGPTIIKVKTWD